MIKLTEKIKEYSEKSFKLNSEERKCTYLQRKCQFNANHIKYVVEIKKKIDIIYQNIIKHLFDIKMT